MPRRFPGRARGATGRGPRGAAAASRDTRRPTVVAQLYGDPVGTGRQAVLGINSSGLADEFPPAPLGRLLLVGVRRDLQAAVEGELLQDVVHVALHRVGRDVEPLRDLLRAQALRGEIR